MLEHIVHAVLISDPTLLTTLAAQGQMASGSQCVHVCVSVQSSNMTKTADLQVTGPRQA